MSKRAHGSGSIYRLPAGTWRALITVEGRRISHTEKTQKAATEWANKMTGQVEQGLTLSCAKTSFSAILDTWFEVKQTRLRGNTQENYQRMINLYLKPGLGNLVARELNPARIQAFYNALEAHGTGRRTIEIVHVVLHGCLEYARRLGLVVQNWAELVEVPRPEKREMKVWNENQVSAFLAGAPDQTFYRLAFHTGARRGELWACNGRI